MLTLVEFHWLKFFAIVIIYVYKLVTVTEGNPKAPFPISTTNRCRSGHYAFAWIAPLTLDLNLIMLSVKQSSIKYHF